MKTNSKSRRNVNWQREKNHGIDQRVRKEENKSRWKKICWLHRRHLTHLWSVSLFFLSSFLFLSASFSWRCRWLNRTAHRQVHNKYGETDRSIDCVTFDVGTHHTNDYTYRILVSIIEDGVISKKWQCPEKNEEYHPTDEIFLSTIFGN